ncbi:MAG: hypothetical protein NTY50_01760 [Methylobacter sp.]|nr:hypothetical protein [Methylobacter sp.]
MMFQVWLYCRAEAMNGSTALIGNKVPKTTENRVQKDKGWRSKND